MFFLSQRPSLVAWRFLLNLGEQKKHWKVEVATAQKPRCLVCMVCWGGTQAPVHAEPHTQPVYIVLITKLFNTAKF